KNATNSTAGAAGAAAKNATNSTAGAAGAAAKNATSNATSSTSNPLAKIGKALSKLFGGH
ncbi:MAG: hypothetical protein WAK17_29470, partial [Candidatus Nitrosopolaris sp.]